MQERERTYDIIIPVYGALSYLRQCINSVLEKTRNPYNLVIIDDGNSPIIKEYLRTIESARIITNNKNLGWLKGCNIGMENTENDVVLLHSDTIMTEGWLEKIDRCAYSSSGIGMVNPLSNNALFLSIPYTSIFNPIPAGFTLESFARLISELSESRYPSMPTVLGFCLLIKRELINCTGLFDEKFEEGCGEEHSLFMRAKRRGYKAVCCDEAFVYHYGWKNFGDSPYRIMHRIRADRKYPDFRVRYRRFIDRFNTNSSLSYLRTKLIAKICEILPKYKGKVSVIMAVYNKEKYLGGAVKSVLGQSYSNFELIIVDNDSTDNSLNIARGFGKEDARVIVIASKGNVGDARAKNEGLKKAKGEFITFMDSDGIMLPNAIKSRVKYLNSHPEVDLVFGKIHKFIDGEENPIENGFSEKIQQLFGIEKNYGFYERLKKLEISIPNLDSIIMFRRDIFFRSGYYEESSASGAEKDFFFRIMKESNIYYLSEAIVCSRMQDSNLSEVRDRESGEWVKRPQNMLGSRYGQEFLGQCEREIEEPKKVYRGLQVELLLGQIAYMGELINELQSKIREQSSAIIAKNRFIYNMNRTIKGKYQYIINLTGFGFGRRLKKLISKLIKRKNSAGETEKTCPSEDYLQSGLITQIEYMAKQIELLRSKVNAQRVAMIAKDQYIDNLNRVVEEEDRLIFELVRKLNGIKKYFDYITEEKLAGTPGEGK